MGRFGVGVDITFDPRTIGMQIDDTIMQKNLNARLALTNKKYFLSIQSGKRRYYFYLVKLMNQKRKLKLQKWLGKLKA